MKPKPKELIYLRYHLRYKYYLAFDDGSEGVVDLKEYLSKGPIFEPLRDMDFFRQARIEGGTIAWPNGADIAPERVYEMVEGQAELGTQP